MALEQKQKYRSVVLDRKGRDKPMHLWSPYMTKEAIMYNREEIISSISGDAKTGQLHVK